MPTEKEIEDEPQIQSQNVLGNKLDTKNIDPEEKFDEKIKLELDQLKQIRISNTLSRFEKKELISFKEEFNIINEYLMDSEFSSIISLIKDGELKAKGKENLIFVYKLKNLEEKFNSSLLEIEKVFYKIFGINYKPIAIYFEEWEPIKLKFNENIKNKTDFYEYTDDKSLFEKIFNLKKDKTIKETNSIENMFKDMIIYN